MLVEQAIPEEGAQITYLEGNGWNPIPGQETPITPVGVTFNNTGVRVSGVKLQGDNGGGFVSKFSIQYKNTKNTKYQYIPVSDEDDSPKVGYSRQKPSYY